jgi:hypothetical protein
VRKSGVALLVPSVATDRASLDAAAAAGWVPQPVQPAISAGEGYADQVCAVCVCGSVNV